MMARLLAMLALGAIMLGLMGCSRVSDPEIRVSSGELNLRGWNFHRRGPVRLDGEWHFYPGELLVTEPVSPTPELARVPANWAFVFSEDAGGSMGYATYQLIIRLPADRSGLGLHVKTLSSAYAIYANGRLIGGAGRVGVSKAQSQPEYRPQVIPLGDLPDTLSLSIQVSNFDHARGGFWEPVQLGLYDNLLKKRRSSLDLTIFVASAALIFGIYHLFCWLLQPRDLSTLVFALICVALSVRSSAVSEIYLLELFRNLSYEWLLRIEYLSLVSLVVLCVLFVRLIAEEALPSVYLLVFFLLVIYSLLIGLAPVELFTALLSALQLLIVLSVALSMVVVFRALRRGQFGIRIYSFSLAILVVIVAYELVVANVPAMPALNLPAEKNFLASLGFLAMLLAQALVLARRSTATLQELSQRTRELSEAKGRLDDYARELQHRVDARTEDLVKANVQLERLSRIDGLTNLYNRREFDGQLFLAWSDHMRRNGHLSVLMVDVDSFKSYNDQYGHLKGDKVLIAVAEALHGAVSRPSDLVARYGGEEMVVLLPNTDVEGARGIAERMREVVQQLAIRHEGSAAGVVTVSVGVASMVPPRGADPSVLLEVADTALYRAKTTGRNRVCVAAETG